MTKTKKENKSRLKGGWVKTKEDLNKLLEKFKCCNKKEENEFGTFVRWSDLPLYMKIGIIGGWIGLIYTILENWNYSHLL